MGDSPMRSSRRLVYFSDSIIPSRLANGVQVMKMCGAFVAAGASVTLLARKGRARCSAGGVPHDYYGVQPSFGIVFLPRLPWLGGKRLYGFLGALMARILRAGLVYGRCLEGCYFAALLGLPVVYEAHAPADAWNPGGRKIFQRLVRKRTFRRLVVISRALQKHYEETFAHLGLKADVLPDAADPPAEMEAEMEAEVEERLRVRPKGPGQGREQGLRVGYVGHLYPGKGMETIAVLATLCPWAEFHIVGGSEDLLRHWRERCAGQENLLFHGFVPPSRTDGLRMAFDVLIAPYARQVRTRLERDIAPWMSPLKLFEYMAAGKPILCSDLPVLREVMEHDRNCLLCPPEEIGQWKLALERLRDHPELRKRLGNTAREDFRNRHGWEARAKKILRDYAN